MINLSEWDSEGSLTGRELEQKTNELVMAAEASLADTQESLPSLSPIKTELITFRSFAPAGNPQLRKSSPFSLKGDYALAVFHNGIVSEDFLLYPGNFRRIHPRQ